jgi:PAS domain S-box-containing protein
MAVQSYKEGIRYTQQDLNILNFVSSQVAQSIARKQSEEALRASEESFRGLFNSVAEAIYIQDADGRFLDVNDGAVKMYGYPREFFIGKTPEPLSAPGKNDLAKIAKAVKAAYDGQPQQFEFWGLRANGEVFPKDVRLYKGVYFGRDVVIALAQDITERKQAEEKIARRLTELEALYQSGIGFSQTLDQRDIAEKVIEVLMGRLNWHHAAVRVRRENSDEVELLAFSQSDEQTKDNTWAKSVITHVGQGMAGWVIEHGEIVRSGNVNEDPRYVETFAGMKSGLYIPMKIHNRTIGCISVESEQPDAFTEDDERVMLTLAVQASAAIENARLYESALLAAQRRGVLYQAGQDMVRIRQDLEQVYMAVHHAVSQLMAAEAFTIALLDEANNEVEGVYLYDKGGRWPSQRVPLGKGFSSRVILTGKTLLITDIEKTPVEAVPFGTQEQIRSVLAVPMFIGGKAIGAIAAQSYQPNAYTAEDQRLLEMLATQASIAIENARLFTQTEARAREFSSLYAVAADLASSNDLNALLNTIAGHIASLLDATGGAVYLFRPEINELEVVADTYDKISIGTRLKLGEGMAGRVAESRQPMMIDDYERWEGRSPQYEGFSYSAVLEVPMIYSGELVGVLTAYHVHSSDPSATESRKFNENDMRLLSLFASHAAGAVYSARLFEAERRRRQDAETLRQAAATLSSSLDLDQVLDNLLNGVSQVIPYTSSSVFILEGEFVRIVAARGFAHPENVIGHSFPAQNGLCRAIFETRRPLILADAQTDPRFENWTHEPHIRGWMGVPLIAHGEIIGHLTLDSDQPDAYTPHDAEMALAFASQAAAAIANARLFDQLNQRLRQLSGLHAIDMAISSSTELSVILDVVVNNTINLLKVDAAAVLLYDPVLQLLKFKSGAGFQTGEIGRASLRLGEGLAGRAALHRENVHVPNDFASHAEPARRPLVEMEGFTAYSCAPLIAKGELKGVLEIFHRSPLELNADSKEFLNVLAGQAAIAVDSAGMFENLQASNTELMLAYDATIEGWSRALDLRDQETEGHTQRVTSMTMELARAMGIPESEMVHIRRGGLLHDMGKLGIPDAILLKPGALTEEEWNLMRKHPQYAYDMLSPIGFLRPALEIPYCHHEKWDGTGYPRGLKGEQIPIAARVFAVIDVWDALCSDRPYRPAWPREKALEHIKSLSGIHFDPRVVEAFLKLISEEEEGD